MALFQKSIVEKYLEKIDQSVIDRAYQNYSSIYVPKINRIKELTEEKYQTQFLQDIFGSVLGYTVDPDEGFNIELEKKNENDSKRVDGAIIKEDSVLGVIELKSTKTRDLEKVKDQAFGYKNNHKGCKYVISSNFHKLRFYVDDATEYEEFDLFNLSKSEFRKFYLYLRKEGLLDKDVPKLLKEETKFHEENISKKLYKDYSSFKNKVFENFVKNNPQHDKLILFKKSQKFLDRILFILFAEDKGLIPENAIPRIVKSWSEADDLQYKPLYDLFKIFFGHLNVGHKYKKTGYEIPAYNGGLFAPDEILDNIIVDDEVLKDDLLILSKYDFNSEVDVNILGHIFEHSLSEIEEVEAKLRGEVSDKSKSKRKKDGVFYTPKYITKYIVDNTVGKLCLEKRDELGVIDEEYAKGRRNRKKDTIQTLSKNLEEYRNWLLNITICDPACGSGAFLNQALEFLIKEHQYIDELESQLLESPIVFNWVEDHILEKNLFGVDINEESVQIARLSLWLRTAKKGRKLTALNNNIKCGNSLIDDPAVAGDKSFIWEEEFPEIFSMGGFDVIIGNPPYVRRTELPENIKTYIEKNYYSAYKQYDLYVLFNELALKIIKNNSYIGFIQPNKFLSAEYGHKINNLLAHNSEIVSIYNVSLDKIFEDASVYPYIFIYRKFGLDFNIQGTSINLLERCQPSGLIGFDLILKSSGILEKINKNSVDLGSISSKIKRGVPNSKLEFKEHGEYFGIKSTLLKYSFFQPKPDTKFNYLNEKDKENKTKEFEQNLIMMPRTILKLRALKKDSASHILDRIYYFNINDDNFDSDFIISVLNSKVSTFYYDLVYGSTKIGGGYIDLKGSQIENFRIPICSNYIQEELRINSQKQINLTENLDLTTNKFLDLLQSELQIESVSKKLEYWYEIEWSDFEKELKKLKKTLIGEQKEDWFERFNRLKLQAQEIKNKINQTDKEIDQVVYELYGLTEEEIKIVEES